MNYFEYIEKKVMFSILTFSLQLHFQTTTALNIPPVVSGMKYLSLLLEHGVSIVEASRNLEQCYARIASDETVAVPPGVVFVLYVKFDDYTSKKKLVKSETSTCFLSY